MDELIAGYRRFRQGYYKQHGSLYRDLAIRGQKPETMMIGCSDSRVDPAITFDTSPGEVFMVRNVAAIVPPYAPDGHHHATSSALEFAVKGLEVRNIVVLGHARCGGIAALMRGEDAPPTDFIGLWTSILAPAREKALEQSPHDHVHAQELCEQEGVRVSCANLHTYPWIAERVRGGKLVIHGWYFDLTTGELYRLDPDGHFSRVPD